MATQNYKAWSVVASSTIAFTVCFMAWMMFAVIGIPIKLNLGLNETQFGILVALPVLTGSLIRLPLGMWTDRFGGRIVFFLLMVFILLLIFVLLVLFVLILFLLSLAIRIFATRSKNHQFRLGRLRFWRL